MKRKYTFEFHAYPIHDSGCAHVLGSDCPCQPEVDAYGNRAASIVHHAIGRVRSNRWTVSVVNVDGQLIASEPTD